MDRITLRRTASVFGLVIALAAGAAFAAPRTVVVQEFTGARSDEVRRFAVRALTNGDGIKLVPKAQVNEARRAIRLVGDGPVQAATLGHELGVDLFVEGLVAKLGRDWQIELRLTRGGDGQTITHNLNGGSRKSLGKKLKRTLPNLVEQALATDPRPALWIGRISGKGGRKLRGELARALGSEFAILRPSIVRDGDDMKPSRAIRLEKLGGLIEGQIRGDEARIRVFGADGKRRPNAESEDAAIRPLAAEIRRALKADGVSDDVARRGSSRTMVPRQEPESDERVSDAVDTQQRNTGRPSMGHASIGLRLFSRNFDYVDDLNDTLRDYALDLAPAPAFTGRFYPGAAFGGGFWAHIGIDLRGDSTIGTDSQTQSGALLPTDAYEFTVGLHGRIPAGPAELGLGVGFGHQVFAINDAGPGEPRPAIPNVDYEFVRLAGELHFPISGALGARLEGAWRMVTNTGEIQNVAWFPRLEASGVEATVALNYAINDKVAIEASGELRRYGFDMLPEPGDPAVAGGALDQYLGGRLALVIHLPGAP